MGCPLVEGMGAPFAEVSRGEGLRVQGGPPVGSKYVCYYGDDGDDWGGDRIYLTRLL